MIPLDDPLLVLDTISIGCWFVVAGYHFLMFGFFFFQRFRTRRIMYWSYLALFFLLLALGRGFFIVYDFYSGNFLWWKVATCIQWFGLAFLALLIGYLLLDNLYHQIIIAVPPPVIAILVLVVQDEIILPGEILHSIINYALAPIYAIFVPALFFYLAYNSVGTIRVGSILNGIGFFVLYAGRVIASELVKQAVAPWVSAILAPGLVILSLLIISYGNQYELLT